MSYKVKKGTNNKETPQGGCRACLTARGHKRQLPPVPQRIPGAGPGAVPGPGQQPPDALVLQSLPVGGGSRPAGSRSGVRMPPQPVWVVGVAFSSISLHSCPSAHKVGPKLSWEAGVPALSLSSHHPLLISQLCIPALKFVPQLISLWQSSSRAGRRLWAKAWAQGSAHCQAAGHLRACT